MQGGSDRVGAAGGHSSAEGPADSLAQVPARLIAWARELGFASAGVAGIDLARPEPGLRQWLSAGLPGEVESMARPGERRGPPARGGGEV